LLSYSFKIQQKIKQHLQQHEQHPSISKSFLNISSSFLQKKEVHLFLNASSPDLTLPGSTLPGSTLLGSTSPGSTSPGSTLPD
jgi:hypothetical protein